MVCKWYSCCPIRKFTDDGLLDSHWVLDYCLKENGFKNCIRYKKEETGEYHPDNMLPDGTIEVDLR